MNFELNSHDENGDDPFSKGNYAPIIQKARFEKVIKIKRTCQETE
jgi:hypothetical protein